MEKIGIIVEATSTLNFKFVITDESAEKENLVFSYVEVPLNGNEKIIGRILDVKKENPLLSIEQAGALAKELIEGIGLSFPPERYTYAIAECEVVGLLKEEKLRQNRKPVPPGREVYPLGRESLKVLFYDNSPEYIPIGKIESFGSTSEIPVTIDGNELVTKHFAVFGMTGSGKTNTSAKIIEELAMRGYRIIIFDPHGDYFSSVDPRRSIVNFDGIFINSNGENLKPRILAQLNEEGVDIPENSLLPLLQTLAILKNEPIWSFFEYEDNKPTRLREDIVKILKDSKWREKLVDSPLFKFQKELTTKIKRHNIFPELKYYGRGFDGYTLRLIEGFLGEEFTSAQKRHLFKLIKVPGKGNTYIDAIINKLQTLPSNEIRYDTRQALEGKFKVLKLIYNDLQRMATPAEIDKICQDIFLKSGSDKNIHVFSLYELPENMRKVTVYAIIEYIFRAYKFGIYNETEKITTRIPESKRYPLLFILEEARSLIPAHAAQNKDYAGWLAVSALRDLAYEGRKFKLSYGIISQKPATVDAEVVSQCNTLILHQLKNPDDQDYVKKVTEGLTKVEIEMLKNIGTGKAVITGTATKSTILVEVFKRYSLEGVIKPTPLKDALEEFKIDELKNQLSL